MCHRLFGLGVLIGLLMGGCSDLTRSDLTPVQAPYDGYVCYPDDHPGKRCADTVLPEKWKEHLNQVASPNQLDEALSYPVMTVKGRTGVRPLGYNAINDAVKCPTVAETVSLRSPGSAADKIPRSLISDPTNQVCVAFVSPILLMQVIQEKRRLELALDSCRRIEKQIGLQRRIFNIEDELWKTEQQRIDLNTEALRQQLTNQNVLTADERQVLRGALKRVQDDERRLRILANHQLLSSELPAQLNDAILQVWLAKNSLENQLFFSEVLSNVSCSQQGTGDRLYPGGSWVKKGTEVYKFKRSVAGE